MAEAAHAHDHPAHDGAPSRAKVLLREPLVLNNRNYSWITNKIAGVVENPQPKLWWYIFIPCFLLTLVMVGCFTYLVSTGVGVWGPNTTNCPLMLRAEVNGVGKPCATTPFTAINSAAMTAVVFMANLGGLRVRLRVFLTAWFRHWPAFSPVTLARPGLDSHPSWPPPCNLRSDNR